MRTPRAIFVLGCPRSGTTMMGRYLGSSAAVCDMGEFGGFYFTTCIARSEFQDMPSKFAAEYLQDLRCHAQAFAQAVAVRHDCEYYLDDTPWNLLAVRDLLELGADPVFVLMLRHPAGVVRSLGRSFKAGFSWAGPDVATRAELWATFNRQALLLPAEQAIAVSYEALCASPRTELERLSKEMVSRDVELGPLDILMLAKSHATKPVDARPTIVRQGTSGEAVLAPFDAAIDDEINEPVDHITSGVAAELRTRYPQFR